MKIKVVLRDLTRYTCWPSWSREGVVFLAGEFIEVFPTIGDKGIVAASVACVVDLGVPVAHAGGVVPVLEGQIVLSWRYRGSQAVAH